jgi:hypothetical protein
MSSYDIYLFFEYIFFIDDEKHIADPVFECGEVSHYSWTRKITIF